MRNTIFVEFENKEQNSKIELELPLNITANDLIVSLNETYKLGMDVENIFNCYLVAENPIALLRGNKTLEEFGLRDGTLIIYKRG